MNFSSITTKLIVSAGLLAMVLSCSPGTSFGQEAVEVDLERVVEAGAEPIEVQAEEWVVEDVDEDEVIEVQVGNPFGVDLRKLQAAKKFQLIQLFAVEVEELKSICDLNKQQSLKLKIAIKGAVKKLTADWVKKNNRQMGNMMGAVQQPKKKKKEDEEELIIKDADEIDEMTLQFVMMNMMGGNPYKNDDPRDSRFWRKTVKSVLTEEQQEKFKAVCVQRKKAKRRALTNYMVSSMAVELGMDNDQTKKFEAIVRPVMDSAKMKCITLYEPYLMYYFASKADKKKMKELLSPAQLQKWKIFLGPSKQIGQMIEGGNAIGQVNGGNGGFWEDVENIVEDVAENVVAIFDGFAKKK